MSGRNENMMQIVQFVAYCVSVVGIYGISRRAAITRTGSLFAAATFGLLIEVVMEATTVQNDLLLASYVGIMVYSLLSFGHDGRLRYLGLFAAALGVALGIKASALLAVPSILVVLGCMLAWLRNDGRSRHSKHRTALSLTALVGAGLLLFTLPAGYVENFRQYQHPLGPVNVRAIHTFENRGLSTVLENGGKNGVRYGIDFANLDGLPRLPAVVKVNRFVRDVLIRAFDSMSVHLVEESESRRPFDPGRPPSSHEDHANWGILGWALILPGVVAVAFGVLRTRRIPRLLSLAFLVFLIAQSFSGPYDPWRGRYFVVAGLFAVPVAGCLFDRLTKRAAVAYVILIALLGSANAVSAVCFRDGRSLIPFDGSKSIMSMNRLEQLTVRRPFMYDIVANFERLVPASASVGLVLGDNEGEYLFFGEKLTRKIVPLRNRRTVPPDVQYVVFQGHLLPALPGEVGLGRGWYLRKLPSR
jgi:4-amino-4-deoxy-L-arabinose transferase-like glycosyltransferase